MKFKALSTTASILALSAFTAVGFGLWGGAAPSTAAAQSANIAQQTKTAQPAAAADPVGEQSLRLAIAQVARENLPAVAHIEVTEQQQVAQDQPFGPFSPSLFNSPQNMPRKREVMALGSGMIMDSQGHILTNNHVVAGAAKISVQLNDGRTYPAKVVGTDPKTDLAVIKIDAGNPLPHVTFGNSDKIEVGDWVVAIGQPEGLTQTVTQGIISAKHRRGILNPSGYQDYLQTDAPINPGNSGGPLIDLNGHVIGVNSAIISKSGGFEGIGFSIPSNMAVHVAQQLIAHGKVERGWLGVTVQDVTPQLRHSLDLPGNNGALVRSVVKGGPAAAAGIQKNDLILAYDGRPVADSGDLQNKVADGPIGRDVPVVIERSGHKQDVTLKTGSQQEEMQQLSASMEQRLGARFSPVTPQEAQRYGMQEPMGVVITSVEPNGVLAKAGFEVNDIILAIDNQPVSGLRSLSETISAAPKNKPLTVTALDHRTGQTGSVDLAIPQS